LKTKSTPEEKKGETDGIFLGEKCSPEKEAGEKRPIFSPKQKATQKKTDCQRIGPS